MSDEQKPYWKGMCEKCDYATQFQLKPWLYWRCAYYDKAMAGVEGCSGPKKAPDKDAAKSQKSNLEVPVEAALAAISTLLSLITAL
jgi:hypothetical protein